MAFSGKYVTDDPVTAFFIILFGVANLGQFFLTLLLIIVSILKLNVQPEQMGTMILVLTFGFFAYFVFQYSKETSNHQEDLDSKADSAD